MTTFRNRGVSDSLLLIMSTFLIGVACVQDTIASRITLTSLKQNRNMNFPPKTGSSLDIDKLDAIFRKMIEEDLVPGLVVYARRGNHIYHKALALRIWQPSLHVRPCRMNPVRPIVLRWRR